MEVPETALNRRRRGSNSSFVGDTAPVYAAITLTPGAVMSGFRISGATVLGPLEEKEAITGAGFNPKSVLEGVMCAVGFLH